MSDSPTSRARQIRDYLDAAASTAGGTGTGGTETSGPLLVTEADDTIRLTRPVELDSVTAFLGSLVGAPDLLPEALKGVFGSLRLDELAYRPAGRYLGSALDLSLSWPARWSIDDAVTLRAERLAVHERGGVTSAEVEGSLTALGLELDVTLQVPSLILDGVLVPDDARGRAFLDAHRLAMPAGHFRPDEGEGPRLEQIDVHVAARDKHVVAHGMVSNLLDAAPFHVERVEAEIDYASGSDGGFTGRLWTTLGIDLRAADGSSGAATTRLELLASAVRTTNGWAFSAEIAPGETLRLGAVAEALGERVHAAQGNTFSASDLRIPSFLNDIAITSFGVTFVAEPGSDRFTFRLSVELDDLDGAEVLVWLELGGGRSEAGARVSVVGLSFEAEFTRTAAGDGGAAPSESLIVATLRERGGTLTLDALVRALAGEAVWTPPIDVGVRDAGFAYLSDGRSATGSEGGASQASGTSAADGGSGEAGDRDRTSGSEEASGSGEPSGSDNDPGADGGGKSPKASSTSRSLLVLDLELGGGLSLGALPSLGTVVPSTSGAGGAGGSGSLGTVQIVVALDAFGTDELAAVNTALGAADATPIPMPTPATSAVDSGQSAVAAPAGMPPKSAALASGFGIRATLNLGGNELSLSAGNAASSARGGAAPSGDASAGGTAAIGAATVEAPSPTGSDAASRSPSGGAGDAGRASDRGGADKAPAVAKDPGASSGLAGANWFPIQKKVGSVYLDKVGVNWAEARLWLLVSGSVTLGPLALSLDSAGFSTELTAFDPEFHLRGLSIDFKAGGIELAGGFLTFPATYTPPGTATACPYTGYAGALIVKTELATLRALGSYAKLPPRGDVSLFLYAALDYPIGGPPFFFVTGLAGGFGYNRRVRVPPAERVAEFAFVEEIAGPAAAGPPPGLGQGASPGLAAINGALNTELTRIANDVPVEVGEYFGAVGIRFTSFEQIDSIVVLTVELGNRAELVIAGLSTAVVPAPSPGESADPPPSPLAEVQLATRASFVPTAGFLGVRSVLTRNSFLLSRDCRIGGGFAFCAWFDGEHKGDVVLTIGGYHRLFRAPAHYPRMPRLGFSWKLNDEIGITGDAYFALTPHAVMAGGHLNALWTSGPLSAWFKAGADLLLSWQPYYYSAKISISIGARLTFEFFGTHHLTVEIGGALGLWGPEFSGSFTIKYWVFSLTVPFGDGRITLPPLSWSEFAAAFLPAAPAPLVQLAPGGGLLAKGGGHPERWLLDPRRLEIVVRLTVPLQATEIILRALGTDTRSERRRLIVAAEDPAPEPLGIASMGLTGLSSELTLTFTLAEAATLDDIAVEPIVDNVPASIWAPAAKADEVSPAPLNPGRRTVAAVTGLRLSPKREPAGGTHTQVIRGAQLANETTMVRNALGDAAPAPAVRPRAEADDWRVWVDTALGSSDATATRAGVLDALLGEGRGDAVIGAGESLRAQPRRFD